MLPVNLAGRVRVLIFLHFSIISVVHVNTVKKQVVSDKTRKRKKQLVCQVWLLQSYSLFQMCKEEFMVEE